MFSVKPVHWFVAGSSCLVLSLFFADAVLTVIGGVFFWCYYYRMSNAISSHKEIMVARVHDKIWSCRKDHQTNEYVWYNKTDEHRFPAEEYSQRESEEELRQLVKWVTPLKVFKKK